jgi:CAP-Gly domain
VGAVKGKQGSFVGIDLRAEFQGKNDGSVGGIRYFSTSASNSGMFVPLGKAEKLANSRPATTTALTANYPRSRTTSGTSTPAAFVTPVGRPRQSTTGSTNAVRTQSPVKSRFTSISPKTPGSITPKPNPRPAVNSRSNFTTPSVVPPRPASVASVSSSVSSRLSLSMDSSLQITKLHRKVAALTEELITLRDSQPLLEQTLKSKDKVVAEKDHALRLMEIERQNQRAELEEMERQVTQLQGFLEERSPHNSSAKIAGVDDSSVNVTGFKTKLEMEELRREIEGLKQDLADRDSQIRQLRLSPRSARVEDTKVRELEELVAAYKEEIMALEQELDEARQQMKEDEIAQRGVVDQISVLEGVVENMERGLIAEKKLGERNVKRIRELEGQLKAAQSRIEELERDEEERMKRKHTSVDRLPDSHPQKRQTVQFLEQEVEKWKRLSALSSERLSGRRTSTGSGGSGESPEEVKGLKLIIEQLTRENVQVESENRRLKEKVTGTNTTSGEGALRERLDAAEREREQLRSEVNDLEGLLETKIFREEELEKELEYLRLGHASTPPLRRKDSSSSAHRPHSGTPPTTSPPPPPVSEEAVVDESLWCEICEEKGHDILGCKAVFGDKPAAGTASKRSTTTTLNGNGKVGMGERRSVGYCENCDRWDHTTEGNYIPLLSFAS